MNWEDLHLQKSVRFHLCILFEVPLVHIFQVIVYIIYILFDILFYTDPAGPGLEVPGIRVGQRCKGSSAL